VINKLRCLYSSALRRLSMSMRESDIPHRDCMVVGAGGHVIFHNQTTVFVSRFLDIITLLLTPRLLSPAESVGDLFSL